LKPDDDQSREVGPALAVEDLAAPNAKSAASWQAPPGLIGYVVQGAGKISSPR